MTTVTLDTTNLDDKSMRLIDAATQGKAIELTTTSVSVRELGKSSITIPSEPIVETAVWGESRWGEAKWSKPIPETLVIGESHIGKAVIGDSSDRFEFLLRKS